MPLNNLKLCVIAIAANELNRKRQWARERYRLNRDKLSAQAKVRHLKDPNKKRTRARKYYAEKLANNPVFRAKQKINYQKRYALNKESYRIADAQFRAKNMAKLYALKKTLKCECGESHPACLDFHHKEPGTKVMAVGKMVRMGYGEDRVAAEIAKCVVLCANCHRKHTAIQLGWYSSK